MSRHSESSVDWQRSARHAGVWKPLRHGSKGRSRQDCELGLRSQKAGVPAQLALLGFLSQ
jgi:hypothetical protein